MILTNKQEQGLKIAVNRFKNKEPHTVIAGYSGVGKSTLIKYIVSALNLNPITDVCYVAYTGKAASVLNKKGCPNACTAHKLLYHAKPLPNGKFKFIPKPYLEDNYKLIVVDEVSMLPIDMWELLLSHKIHVLACGDPFQNPPIIASMNNHVLDKPHIFLDEIVRQAYDSEIIRLSKWIRDGKPIESYKAEKVEVDKISKFEINTSMYTWADQIICSTNKTRNLINKTVRNYYGYGDMPVIGDKIISLKNHWDFLNQDKDNALINGTIGTINSFSVQEVKFPNFLFSEPVKVMISTIDAEGDNERFCGVPIDYNELITSVPTFTPEQEYSINKYKYCMDTPFSFNYAYAITCHKAQGSEWPKVMVIEEGFPNIPLDHSKWLYTAVTRAQDKVLLVSKN